VGKIIVGQARLIDGLLIGLLTDGHVLVEGVPGLAKTLAVKAVAAALALTFRRVQFTPDLLPADITGTLVYNARSGVFEAHRGPVFANLVLADEINRAPAKVQSALLEAMQERRVTIGDTTYPLGEPFLVLATQNPIEHEGTYPLPEAQLDRFLMQIRVDYPSRDEELEVLKRGLERSTAIPDAVIDARSLAAAKVALGLVRVDPKVQSYLLDLVRSTRPSNRPSALAAVIRHGASPRTTVHLGAASRAHAFLAGRDYVIPEDVREVAGDVLSHRLLLSYEAEADNVSTREVVQRLLLTVPVP
jgi:MoxR-like ATPase